MTQKDERVKIMNEILSGIKVIIHGTVRYLPHSFLRFCPNRMSLQNPPATSETKIVFRLVYLIYLHSLLVLSSRFCNSQVSHLFTSLFSRF